MPSTVRKILPAGVRSALIAGRFAYRQATAALRSLPDFQIIGAQKCGTSSLLAYLTGHPSIGVPLGKELHYFDLNYSKGLNWYRSHFPLARRGLYCGEASPYYLYHPLACDRIRRLTPHAKLIVLLRNPIDRAFSHYQHNVRRNHETLSFENSLAGEQDRLAGEEDKIVSSGDYSSAQHQHLSYRSKGLYAQQLRRWFQVFPSDQFHIIRASDFFRDTRRVYAEVLDFLALPPFEPPGFEVRNANPSPSKLDPRLRSELARFYKPHNQELYDLLGRDFGWNE